MPLLPTLLSLARPRTLPLAAAAIFCGNALAWHANPAAWRFGVFALSLLTALALQIVSNIANDYGDGLRGTDRYRAAEAPPASPPRGGGPTASAPHPRRRHPLRPAARWHVACREPAQPA